MYVAQLWVRNLEVLVAAVAIRLVLEFLVEFKNVIHELKLEFLHIALVAFAAQEFSPCLKQVLY